MTVPILGNWYVWVRAQCGPWPDTAERADGCVLHWGANDGTLGSDRTDAATLDQTET